METFFSAYLPIEVQIHPSVVFFHKFHGIFISKRAKIGQNCRIYHHVTIGSSKDPNAGYGVGERCAPVIGNNVFIGANCTIIGKTVIGDDCVIGAGTTIANAEIPPNSLVVSQKYRVISRVENSIIE